MQNTLFVIEILLFGTNTTFLFILSILLKSLIIALIALMFWFWKTFVKQVQIILTISAV